MLKRTKEGRKKKKGGKKKKKDSMNNMYFKELPILQEKIMERENIMREKRQTAKDDKKNRTLIDVFY